MELDWAIGPYDSHLAIASPDFLYTAYHGERLGIQHIERS